MFKFLMPLLLCAVSVAAEETALDRLKEGVVLYLRHETDGASLEKQKKLVAKLNDRVQQKMADTKLSEDACLSQMAIDFLGDNKGVLEAGPESAKPEKLFEIVVMAKYYLDKNGEIKGWKDYETGIEKWAKYLKERVDAKVAEK